MSDFASRLARRALGVDTGIRPRTAGLFEPPGIETPSLDEHDPTLPASSPAQVARAGTATPSDPVLPGPAPSPQTESPAGPTVQRRAVTSPQAPPATSPSKPSPPAPSPPAPADARPPLTPAARIPATRRAGASDRLAGTAPGAVRPAPAAGAPEPEPGPVAAATPRPAHVSALVPPTPPAPLVPLPAEHPEPATTLPPVDAPPRRGDDQPTVRISIGRVDVRAVTAPQAAPRPPARAARAPLVPLDDYLERDTGARR